MADLTRRSSLTILVEKELPIVAISRHFSLSRTAINKHLKILYDSNLVMKRKDRRETLYRLNPGKLVDLKDWLGYFDEYWDLRLTKLKRLTESEDLHQE
ncbi:MAG: ArsR family transcriptional regulator [Candidatus Thermoplasmatota archaeon]|nr:ArsR family transcriptional regulator [Candidatus Thermoplasmatota archaeon]MCL6003408.1 ArsR family transcriptional regulator [Candidatus Thermoplasmatota archaeon]